MALEEANRTGATTSERSYARLHPRRNALRDLTEEATLLARAQAGDRDAFWELAAPSVDAIYRLARRLVKSDEDAEDIVQEAFLKALSKIGEFKGMSRFTTWIHRIAVNEALMKLRKDKHRVFTTDSIDAAEDAPPLELVDWSESALDDLVRREAMGILEQSLESLPIDLRTVIVLRDVNGLSNEEAAQALELPIGAVKWRLHRARTLLRDRLSAYFRERQGAR
jgi:RNA polymerase sigma-70 factor, ECF subfamily